MREEGRGPGGGDKQNKCLRRVPEVRRREHPGSLAPRAALGPPKLNGRSPEREAYPNSYTSLKAFTLACASAPGAHSELVREKKASTPHPKTPNFL